MNTLIHNAKIYTPEGFKSWMLIHDNIIEEIGIDKPPQIKNSIDLKGRLVLPGLQDSHLHVFGTGRASSIIDLKSARSINDIQTILLKEMDDRDDWIIGRNWDQDYLEERRYPNRYDLDKVIPDRPVFLYRACNHIALVNSKALSMLDLNNIPNGGTIDLDDNGEPTGILRENAMNLAYRYIKNIPLELRKEYTYKGLMICMKNGLTAVQTNDAKAWQIYKELQEEGKLPIRVYLSIYYDELNDINTPSPMEKINLIRCDRVKLFADGSLGAQTAYLRENYADLSSDHPHPRGIPIYSQEELNDKVNNIKKLGYQIEIHAIGDAAVELCLNAFDAANLCAADRPIITHAQVLAEDLIHRMSTNGIIANIQPTFLLTDSQWVDQRLGEKRTKYAYAWKSLIDNGVHCAGGSDSPIESSSPLLGMYYAIYREGSNGKVWHPEQCLSFDEALSLYTTGASYVTNEKLGILAPGYLADFVVLADDVTDNPELLKTTHVDQVWVDGKLRYVSNT